MARLLLIAAVFMLTRGARAAETPAPLVPLLAQPADAAPMPRATEAAPPAPDGAAGDPKRQGVIVPAAGVADEADEPTRPPDLSYGISTRLRWITVPSFLLGLFTKENVPLSSWATGFEFFRRKGNFDFALSFTYQAMSPPDGNWLGRDREAAADTDYVQFRGLSLFGFDASFIWHTRFNEFVGLHYGAGIGIGFVAGDILRTSNSGCTEANAGDPSVCKPLNVDCPNGVCNEQQLQGLIGPTPDNPAMPHRFADPNVPPVIPIINTLVGLNFRLPQLRGWEARAEGGFYAINFFLGGSVGYTF